MPGKLMMMLVRVPQETTPTTLAKAAEEMLRDLDSDSELVEVAEADETCLM
jgi:hypothetical protein